MDDHDNENDQLLSELQFQFQFPVPVFPGALEMSAEILEFCHKLRMNDPSISQVDTGRFPNLSDVERIAIAESMAGSSVVEKLVLDPENFSEKAAEAVATVLCNSNVNRNSNTNNNGNATTQRLQIVEMDGWIDDNFHLMHLMQQNQQTVSILMGGIQASTSVRELSLSGVNLATVSKPLERLLTETKSLRKLRLAMAGFTLDRQAAVDISNGFSGNTTLTNLELICCHAPHIPLVLEGLHDHATLNTLILDRLATLSGLGTLLQPQQQKNHHAISDLHISRYKFSDGPFPASGGLEQLVTAMQRNITIAKLTISQSSIGRDQAKQLRAMFPRNQTLKSLNLVGNNINAVALCELAKGLYRNTSLEHLDVADNQLNDAAAARVLQHLMRRNKTLTRMDIDRNSIGAIANNVESIADGLRINATLQDVDLSSSMLGDAGVEVLVRGLGQNSTLKTLALCDNGITATGVRVLVHNLFTDCNTCSGITDLVLNGNHIGFEGASLLADASGRNAMKQLLRLHLDTCALGDDCLTALASAMERNDTLQLLSMEGNDFGERGFKALAWSLPEIKALQRVDFTWNPSVASNMTSLLEGFRKNTSLVHVNIPGFEPGEWMARMNFLQTRNKFLPLLLAPDNDLPLGIWSHALAKIAADPDVLLFNLCSKPGLVRVAVKTLKRSARSLDDTVRNVNQVTGNSKKQKKDQVE